MRLRVFLALMGFLVTSVECFEVEKFEKVRNESKVEEFGGENSNEKGRELEFCSSSVWKVNKS
jgi:hypothetical protein